MGFYDPTTGEKVDPNEGLWKDLTRKEAVAPGARVGGGAPGPRTPIPAPLATPKRPTSPTTPPNRAEQAYERYIAGPLTQGATPLIRRLMRTPPVLAGQPSPMDLTKYVAPETIAKGVVPQTIPEAGTLAGMALGGPAGLVGRLGGAALGRGLGAAATGQSFTPEALKGAGAGALAELPLIPLRPGLYASMAQRDFAGAVSKVLELPELAQATKRAGVNIVESLRGGKVADALGAKAKGVYDEVYNTFGNRPVFRLPTTVKGKYRPATWDEVRNTLTNLSKRGWTDLKEKGGGPAFDYRKMRQQIAEHAKEVINTYNPDLANSFEHINELWNKYYAIHDLTKRVDFRPESGRFIRVGGQKQFAKDAAALRRKLGDADFKTVEKALFGGETRHAGFDRPGALSRRGTAPGTLVESPSGIRGYMRSIPTHERPLTSQFIGKSPLALTLLRLFGIIPAGRGIEKAQQQGQ